jgi:hypothetical protein
VRYAARARKPLGQQSLPYMSASALPSQPPGVFPWARIEFSSLHSGFPDVHHSCRLIDPNRTVVPAKFRRHCIRVCGNCAAIRSLIGVAHFQASCGGIRGATTDGEVPSSWPPATGEEAALCRSEGDHNADNAPVRSCETPCRGLPTRPKRKARLHRSLLTKKSGSCARFRLVGQGTINAASDQPPRRQCCCRP